MYIQKFEIDDLRCFSGHHEVELDHGDGTFPGWTVFAGRNGTGKTSLLQALVLAYIDVSRATAMNRGARWTRPAQQLAQVRLRFDPASDGQVIDRSRGFFALFGVDEHSNRFNDVLDHVGRNEQGDFTARVMSNYDLEQTIQSHGLDPATPLIAYGACRIGQPSRLEENVRDPLSRRVGHLLGSGGALQDGVLWLQSIHTRALEEQVKHRKPNGHQRLKDDVIRLLNDGLLPDSVHVSDVDADGLWVERAGIRLPLENIADGYRSVTSLVLDMIRHLHDSYGGLDLQEQDGQLVCPRPAVVLIDEVDAHMHIAWQQRIGFWLTEHFPAIQFLVTTHSPFICQAASPRGLIRLPAPDESTTIEHVSEDTWRAVKFGGADDAVMSDLFGLDHARSDLAESQRDDLARLEAKILRGQATEAEKRGYQALKARIGDGLADVVDRQQRARRVERRSA